MEEAEEILTDDDPSLYSIVLDDQTPVFSCAGGKCS